MSTVFKALPMGFERLLPLLVCCAALAGCSRGGWSDLGPAFLQPTPPPRKTNWTYLQTPQIGESKFPAYRSIVGLNEGRSLWVVGDGGIILHSTDGNTWTPKISNTQNALHSI